MKPAYRPAAWTYRRDYARPCRECHRPILGAARNQRMHPRCRLEATARRQKLRRECRRAARGLFPLDRVPVEQLSHRRVPTPATRRRYYRWHVCAHADCGARFFAGRNARFCQACAGRRIRAANARRGRLWLLRQPPEVLEARRNRWRAYRRAKKPAA